MAPVLCEKMYLVMIVQLFKATMIYIFVLTMNHLLHVYERGH